MSFGVTDASDPTRPMWHVSIHVWAALITDIHNSGEAPVGFDLLKWRWNDDNGFKTRKKTQQLASLLEKLYAIDGRKLRYHPFNVETRKGKGRPGPMIQEHGRKLAAYLRACKKGFCIG